MTKAFSISKSQVAKAYKLVRANAGSAGIDRQSLDDFDENLKDNLYKIWNRLSSGSYFPPPVMATEIPKKSGGIRVLGIPTVSDRIAQMVVRLSFEPNVEPHFLDDSYGYRPNKSALDAIEVTRRRCWKHSWVLEFDIKGLFDNIPHDLLIKAVKKHTKDKWIVLYIQRWLTASIVMPNGKIISREKGTPQGGVISPVLANLFLHYAFDKWMQRQYPNNAWCRYADDGLIHCLNKTQAELIFKALSLRMLECGLEIHPDKTKIVYCKNAQRKQKYGTIKFDFLGYTFSPRRSKSKDKVFIGFNPAVSKSSMKSMRDKIRNWRLNKRLHLDIKQIAKVCNPVLRGWYQYYGKYNPSWLKPIWNQVNMSLVKWAMRKYKKLNTKTRAAKRIQAIMQKNPNLLFHWKFSRGKSFV